MTGASIPELLGFAAIPYDRDKAYGVQSYQAQYLLTEEEAEEVRRIYGNHAAIDMHLAQRYMSDDEYRRRVDKAREDITATPPDEQTKRVMERLQRTMKKPTNTEGAA